MYIYIYNTKFEWSDITKQKSKEKKKRKQKELNKMIHQLRPILRAILQIYISSSKSMNGHIKLERDK